MKAAFDSSRGIFSARRLALAPLLACLVLALGATPAAAREQAFDFCPPGGEGGKCGRAGGVAVNGEGNGGVPVGTVYISDKARIQSFTVAGGFIRAWGWDVIAPGEPNDTGTGFEICEVAAECKAGVEGGGAGQFRVSFTNGIAVEQSSGDVYVIDQGNGRIEQFDASGHFVRTWGKNVDSTGGAGFEICEVAANCQAGEEGEAGGEFHFGGALAGIAVDGAGSVYVADARNRRVQKFDSEGGFLAAAGTDVDSGGGTGYEVCTVAAECKAGVSGDPFAEPQSLAASPAGDVYVADNANGQVDRLSSGLALDTSFHPPVLESGSPRMIAVDSATGRLFLTKNGDSTIYEVDPASGEVVEETKGGATNWFGGLAFNGASGRLYGSPASTFDSGNYIRAYDLGPHPGVAVAPPANVSGATASIRGWVNPIGAPLSGCVFQYVELPGFEAEGFAAAEEAPCAEPDAAEAGEGSEPVAVHADLSGLSFGTDYRYRLLASNAAGDSASLAEALHTLGPVILDTWSQEVTLTEATLKASIDPEGKPTTYRFEWGTEEGSYPNQTGELPVGEDSEPHLVEASLEGLTPGTTYHYRVVPSNADGIATGPDRTFTTYPATPPRSDCPNQAFRTGPGAALPDCRAYELVSPHQDRNVVDISIFGTFADYGIGARSSPGGDALAFAAAGAFAEPEGAPQISQYLSRRDPGAGWRVESLDPPRDLPVDPDALPAVTSPFAFSPDLSMAWLVHDAVGPPLAPGALEGYRNLYRRDNETGAYEALSTVAPLTPPEVEPRDYQLQPMGFPAGGVRTLFTANARLTSDASTATTPSGPIKQLYERLPGGALRLVSVLPGGAASSLDSAVGGGPAGTTGLGPGGNREVIHAVSTDGTRIFWTASGAQGGLGKVYLRVDGTDTVAVSESVSGAPARFWAADPAGERALFTIDDGGVSGDGDALYSFDVATETPTPIAAGVLGLAGASEDLSRVYLVSLEALPGSGQNSEEEKARAGHPNLYLHEPGAAQPFVFIATLSDPGIFPDNKDYESSPQLRTTRVTTDGSHLAFNSHAALTGYDNADALSGKPDREVYLYDADSNSLRCVSCNPSGARPAGVEESGGVNAGVAAEIGPWPTGFYPRRFLAEDGSRLYFESYDPLLPADVNGRLDVYQWEQPGSGDCDSDNSTPGPLYFPPNGGCLALISTGTANRDADFADATPDGSDVFFTTDEALLDPAIDPGLTDVYDARAGGGLAAQHPEPPPGPCEGEACRGASPQAPPSAGAGSAAFAGPGNPKPGCSRLARAARRSARQAKRTRTRAAKLRRAARRSSNPKRSRAARRRAKHLGAAAKQRSRAAKKQATKAKRCRRRAAR